MVRRHVNAAGAEAADDVIHGLLAAWRDEGRAAVVASSDGGFAESLLAHRRCGLPAFLVTTGRPARRLYEAAVVRRLDGVADIDVTAAEIEDAL
jgi:hypothetical protein